MRTSRLRDVSDWAERAKATKYNVGKLAENCGVSVSQLQRFFLQTVKMSPREWLKQLRLMEALSELKLGRSVKEVSFNARFKHVAHFSREFKVFHGAAPSQVALRPNPPADKMKESV
ncbi:MAG TPA: helix-turn-helix transcriptional regulator [Clostridia bacterium]|nr:helix-turn-helix transcriptional regulator [Clostridia bacterium]